VPLILLAPLSAFVIAVSSVRTRRASANTTMLGAVVMLGATLLVGAGLAGKTTAFNASYVYLTTNVAYSGPASFQTFEIDISLHADHLAVAALLVVELCAIGVLAWHRVMGRNEVGPARFQALISVLLFGSAGTLLSTDLAELITFWGLAGGATYLLLAHRWGADDGARNGRVALALPFLTDLFLLAGVGVLYAQYGKQNLNDLVPILHSPGWSARVLVVATVLLFVGIAGRLALWPLHSWITSTSTTAPPASSAIAQAVWPVLAVTVLYRLGPIFAASNAQTTRDLVIAGSVAAVVAALVSLVDSEPRRVLALAGSGLSAVGAVIVIHGLQDSHFTFAVAGVACLLAVAPARAAGVLAASALTAAMRTEDLREMGDAWVRMRASAVVLLAVGITLGLAAAGALATSVDSRTRFGVALGEAVFLLALASIRVFLAAGTGPLHRRRAFDPDRVRDAPPAALSWPYWLVLVALLFGGATFTTRWFGFLDGRAHAAVGAGAYLLWTAVALVGFAVAAFAYARSKDGSLRASGWLDGRRGAGLIAGARLLDRFLLEPSGRIVEGTGEGLLASDAAVGTVSLVTGRLVAKVGRAPIAQVLVVMAVLVALAVALLSPGVIR
jgi:NADH:ubiquinone oxidoreductase subunit 5 (subunit L)/multisubunit Na+/H+ antiporter MnhA subunit